MSCLLVDQVIDTTSRPVSGCACWSMRMSKRGVVRIGEAPFRVVQLGGGHAQIKQHSVHAQGRSSPWIQTPAQYRRKFPWTRVTRSIQGASRSWAASSAAWSRSMADQPSGGQAVSRSLGCDRRGLRCRLHRRPSGRMCQTLDTFLQQDWAMGQFTHHQNPNKSIISATRSPLRAASSLAFHTSAFQIFAFLLLPTMATSFSKPA